MAVDPVCGVPVIPKQSEWLSQFEGAAYYFCSAFCMRTFQSDPSHFLERPGDQAELQTPQTGAEVPDGRGRD